MRGAILALLLAATLAAAANAVETKFRWEIAPPGFTFQVTTAIGPLQTGLGEKTTAERILGVTPERRFGYFCDLGWPAFTRIRDTQDAMVWFHGNVVPDNPRDVYNGGLDSLMVVLRDGTTRTVREIFGSPITGETDRPPLVWVYPRRAPVAYQNLACEIRGKKVWFVYLGFSRTFDPAEVVGIRVPKGGSQ